MVTDQLPGRPTAPTPLHRNRNYTVLWTGQFFSELVGEMLMVALPLLVLSMSGGPLQVGAVASVLAATHMIAVVPAGLLADRRDRRLLMLLSQGGRALALTVLVSAVLLDRYSFALVLAVAAVEGVLSSIFDPAEHAALPQVVPSSQLSAAIARNAARPFIATLAGPAVAGLLFQLGPGAPLIADVVMLTVSFGTLLLLRLPRGPGRTDPDGPDDDGPPDVRSAFRWITRHTVIRTTLVWLVVANLMLSALIVVILIAAGEEGTGPGEIGLMMSCLGLGGVLGALAAGRLHDRVPAPVILLGFSWVLAAATTLMAFVPPGLLLGLVLGGAAMLAPAANTTILTFQLTTTPDGLRGTLNGVAGLGAGVAGALGPLLGGAVVALTGEVRTAILCCAAGLTLVAIGTTVSRTLRRFPAAPAAVDTDRTTATDVPPCAG